MQQLQFPNYIRTPPLFITLSVETRGYNCKYQYGVCSGGLVCHQVSSGAFCHDDSQAQIRYHETLATCPGRYV